MTQQAIADFIRARYAAVHGATAPLACSQFLARMRSTQEGAALGYRRAHDGPLFLERYLDAPVESVLAERLHRPIDRSRIVEIGCLAANSPHALIGLWSSTAAWLGQEAELGVAVLTRPLRRMFGRLGIHLHALAPATADRLGVEAGEWGRYYELDPVVCAGSLEEGRRRLAAFVARRRRQERRA